jgi:hypothetical protein
LSIARQRRQIQRRGRDAVGKAGVALLIIAVFLLGSLIPELSSGGAGSASRARALATLLMAVGLGGIGLWIVSKSSGFRRREERGDD